MRRYPTPRTALLVAAPLLLGATSCGGGGDGGTDPIVVTSVVITAPGAAPSFQTLGRTVQFTGSARDATNNPVLGTAITWQSSTPATATVNTTTGLVTAVANGTTTITAHASGLTSTGVLVTVAQVIDTVNVTPAAIAFGAFGSTRQITLSAIDSSDAPVAGAPAATFTRVGSGTVATVSASGLVTSLADGNTDTALVTVGTKVTRVPISVAQVIANVLVSPTATDTLRTTTRTKQYTAQPRDSNSNAMVGAISWSSSVPGVASVDGNGLATAITDGNTNVIATITGGSISGQRLLVIRRYAATFTLGPSAASITTNLGTQVFNGTAQDTLGNNLTISWASRNAAIITVSPNNGVQTTASANGTNGQTYVVMSGGSRSDSALVTVTGQTPAVPLTATVTVGNNFFRSDRNLTTDQAIDTVAIGGQVTWNWAGGGPNHSVFSTGSPSFTSSAIMSSGQYIRTFPNAGTYTYECFIHNSMTGRIVVK